jgi:peptidoglycan/LPS O-acetylase OafA/YrhL
MNHNIKYITFDLLRGIAALLVCAGHIRNFLLVDFGNVINPSFFDRIFYFATGLGHQAVIIFFVLSGYFVGGSVWKQLHQGKFNWIEYTLTRLSRLWIVLIPALLSTLFFDSVGEVISNHIGYDGRWKSLLSSGPGVGVECIDLSASTFFGNVFFLQTIIFPVFGTNGPLWSLANEFWYYLVFPFIGIALHKRSIQSLLILGIVMACFSQFPLTIFSGFLFWLMGWLAFVITETLLSKIKKWHIVSGVVLFLAALACTKFLNDFSSELVIAVSTMSLLVMLPHIKLKSKFFIRVVSKLSDMSYSLYVFHFPFIAFCWFLFTAPQQYQPTLLIYIQFFSSLVITLIFCFFMYFVFERQTSSVRFFLKSMLYKKSNSTKLR